MLDRIVYTNGELDPWSYGGLAAPLSPRRALATTQQARRINGSAAERRAPAQTQVGSAQCAPPSTSIVIEGSAHHSELRAPLAADPPAVVAARVEVIALVGQWLADADAVITSGQ